MRVTSGSKLDAKPTHRSVSRVLPVGVSTFQLGFWLSHNRFDSWKGNFAVNLVRQLVCPGQTDRSHPAHPRESHILLFGNEPRD